MRAPRSFLAATAVLVALPVAGTAVAGDADDVDAARAGLAAYLVDHRPASPSDSSEIAGCPAIDLGSFQTALDDAGLAAEPIAGWGTEIEWDEWQEIDPELMSIVCAGDADGDAHDSDARLAAGIAVIDAGSDERALEVEQMVGFGTLDAERADVPGGEVMATCVDRDRLAVCVTVWSQDGFVVAILLRSDQRDIPDGAGTLVLEDVLGDVLSTLAAYEGGSTMTTDSTSTDSTVSEATGESPPPFDSPLDVSGALAGLRSLTATLEPVGENEPLTECPVSGRDDVAAALESAGIDSPIATFDRVDGPALGMSMIGVLCEGAYIGSEGDEAFPETAVSLVVADVANPNLREFFGGEHPDELPTPTIGGGTVGVCHEVDRHTECVEYWAAGTFVVGVRIADRVFVDRPTSSAVLVALVPAVVDALSALPAPEGELVIHVGDDQLVAARAGLASLAGDSESMNLEHECAIIDDAVFAVLMDETGVGVDVPSLTPSQTEPPRGSDATIGCTGSGDGGEVAVFVDDFGDRESAQAQIDLARGRARAGGARQPRVVCVTPNDRDRSFGVTQTNLAALS